jgi:pantoate--beta-alanine ligase
VQIIRDPETLTRELLALREEGKTIAFVPTMGALHDGHMALVAEARARADHVVASIFVNPTQFGPDEDLAVYPRREATDAAMLEKEGVAILWAPDAETMYPDGPAATLRASAIGATLEGASRPGHFDGVATVVARLFDQVQPDFALFGEKDYQQLAVIRDTVAARALPVTILAVPTQRDADGLALSSRNAYLSEEERAAARTLPRALGEAVQAIEAGGEVEAALERAIQRLTDAGFEPIDYVVLRDAETLGGPQAGRPARLLAAASIGRTRLIDNLPVSAGVIS